MADLEEQLAQLKLMNSRTLSPKPCNTLQGFAGKKIGPAVPPKPKKPQPLQSNGHPLYHHRAAMGKDYSNMKMTLDNPAILEQQREALEHHKRMLDAMKGPSAIGFGSLGSRPPTNCSTHDPADKIYENQKMLYENTKPAPMSDTLPAPDNYLDGGSGGSLIGSDEGQRSGSSSRMDGYRSGGSIYSNVPQSMSSSNDDGGVLYGNMAQIQDCGASVDSGGEVTPTPNSLPNVRTGDVTYCNINYGGNYQDDLPPPPPLDLTAPSLSAYPHTDYFHETSEEELPPPPSPVSSSYSELRRANDNLSSDQPYTIYNHHQHVSSNGGQKQQLNMHGMHHHHHMIMDSMSGADANSSGSVAGGGGSSIIGNSSIIGGENSVPYPMSSIGGNDVSGYKNDYGIYGSQTSSTYESIYEPINPRPPSQLSSRSNYSLYSPYISGGTNASTAAMQQMHHQHGQQQSLNSHKEAEVKILTDLLVQSMDNGQDVDHYGMCVKCGDRVVGESSGCTAMDQIYHIDCFTCCQCQINLQGKPFYALEGKPYCEEDYLNTLEKCSVCMKPILERILRATGKPYHPVCFCCIVCGKSLDGIPFTVDATNQIHCIEDFHKKFAPRCCVCCEPIMPGPGKEETVRVVALDRSFHISCYKCEDCGLLLSSEAEGRGCYPLDDHVLCKSCNAKQVQALTIHMTTEL